MFEFGFYEKEITPPLGCGIPGYFNIRRGCDVLDTIYESRPGSSRLDKEAGYIMAEKLISMKKV